MKYNDRRWSPLLLKCWSPIVFHLISVGGNYSVTGLFFSLSATALEHHISTYDQSLSTEKVCQSLWRSTVHPKSQLIYVATSRAIINDGLPILFIAKQCTAMQCDMLQCIGTAVVPTLSSLALNETTSAAHQQLAATLHSAVNPQ